MTVRVLELNDTSVALRDGDGLICASPAYVFAEGDRAVFGEEAASRSRLLPLQCNNAFWYRLNMEPLARPLANFRHTADIAHAHLQHLAQVGDTEGDVVIAVPGSLDREQLALLAGLVRHTPFNVVGLIDSATAAVAGQRRRGRPPGSQVFLLVDMHLHQMVVSRLEADHGRIERGQLVTLPELGWMPLSNALVQLATDAFIRQCRFNPRDNALWEQSLYDQLPHWLEQAAGEDHNLLLEIATDSARYQARLTTDGMRTRLQAVYQKLLQHLQTLANGSDCEILVTERCATLPGLMTFLASHARDGLYTRTEPVAPESLVQACLDQGARFLDTGGHVQFVTALDEPAPSGTDGRAEPTAADPQPTHLLREHEAWHLNGGMALARDASGDLLVTGPGASAGSVQTLGRILSINGQIVLQCEENGIVVNGVPVSGESVLALGDSLGTEESAASLRLIRVHDG